MLKSIAKSKSIHGLTLAYAAAIVAIILGANSGVLQMRVVRFLPGGDKMAHFLLMGGLCFLVNMSLGLLQWRRFSVPGACLGLWFIIALEELSQIGLRRRSFELSDLAADTAGIVVFGLFAAFFLYRGGNRGRDAKSLPLGSSERSTI